MNAYVVFKDEATAQASLSRNMGKVFNGEAGMRGPNCLGLELKCSSLFKRCLYCLGLEMKGYSILVRCQTA